MEEKKEENHYVKNKDLLREIKLYRKTCKWDDNGKYIKGSGEASEELGEMIFKIAMKYASRGNFSGYSWKEDLIADAALTVLKYIHNFNPEKSKNPFAYVTTVIHNAFLNYIKKANKHGKIKQICYARYDMLDVEKECFNSADIGINYELLRQEREIK